MTTPHVTELPLALVPVEPDPFVETLPSPMARRVERVQRQRRLDLVRRLMRVQSGDTHTRNGRQPWRTKRL